MPLPRQPLGVDLTGQLLFLGTGTSTGVPALGCDCQTCQSTDPRDRRTRCALVLGLPGGHLLIDTPPDLHSQLVREKVGVAHAVLFTHEHADHLMGLDDVRMFPFYLGHKLPLYCEPQVEERIRRTFDYAFVGDDEVLYAGAVPRLELRTIDTAPFELLGARVTPIRLRHGRTDVLGFRVGNVAYCTDVNEIPAESWPALEGLDVLILDALRHRPHPTHFSLGEAIEVARRVRPGRTLLTHISHEMAHTATSAELPAGVELAYDGLKILLT